MFKGHKMGRCSVQGSTPATERRLAVATWNQLGKYVICACLHLHHVWGTCRYIYIGRYKAHCSPTSGYVSCRTFLASTACWASRSPDKSISGSSSNGMIPALRIPVMADQCANLDARFTGEVGIIRRENDIHSSLRKGKKNDTLVALALCSIIFDCATGCPSIESGQHWPTSEEHLRSKCYALWVTSPTFCQNTDQHAFWGVPSGQQT